MFQKNTKALNLYNNLGYIYQGCEKKPKECENAEILINSVYVFFSEALNS